MTLAVATGDRVRVRDRIWRIARTTALPQAQLVLEIESVDGDAERLSVVAPPEEVERLPAEALEFDARGLDAFLPWSANLRILAATLARDTGLVSGARFGRVALEAYQLAPVFRLLAMPRPSLLVGDDVGLGKTIEAGLAMLELLARQRVQRILIVAPPGLLLQWKEELFEKFGFDFTLIENASGLAREQARLPAGTSPWDVLGRVITSIDFIKKETIRRRALRKRWDLVIVDEAHSLAESGTPQNPYRTQRFRLGIGLRENARGLLLLTATPHNGYPHSFRSLVELVDPTAAALSGSTEALRRRVGRAMIRRLKSQIHRCTEDGRLVEVFPRRNVEGVAVTADEAGRELLHKVAAYCSRTARAAEGTDEDDLITFAMQIVKKRALSSRAALKLTVEHRLDALKKETSREQPPTAAEIRDLQAELPLGDAALERTTRKILRSAIPRDEKRRKSEIRALGSIQKLLRQLPVGDPKIAALLAEIRSIVLDHGEKVIVFTEYLDTLAAVEEALGSEEGLAGRWVVLKGGMGGRRRRKVQEEFEGERAAMLLATDAASEGLNLQRFCRRIIHFELPWNPNRLEQRNGRVDRYGQTRPPEIRYLFYPDSPEEDVLHRLVTRIKQMHGDRVSTPDILGVLSGLAEINKGLTQLDPEAEDLEAHKQSLVRLFDDRTDTFVRDLKPLLMSDAAASDDIERIIGLLNTSEPLLPDDTAFESLMRDVVGPAAIQPTGEDGVFRIEVPFRLRGPGVNAIYPRATFRRSVAVRFRAEDVEYVTPLHPLVRAAAAEARRRLVQVYPDERGLPPRRFAARRVAAGERPSVLFAFLGTVTGASGLREERLLLVRLGLDGDVIQNGLDPASLLVADGRAGEVGADKLSELFAGRFDALVGRAAEEATRAIQARTQELRQRRAQQAQVLRADLQVDRADREREIDEEERRARGDLERSGQLRLTLDDGPRTGSEVARAKRAALEAFVAEREREIDELEHVDEPAPPAILAALFLVPDNNRGAA